MKKKLKIISVLIVAIILLLFICDNRLKIVNYTLETDKISGEVKLALVSDLHCCLYGENQSEVINAIDTYKPDAVFLGGDIFDDDYVNNNSHIFIDDISKKYKTYYVSGNHEWWSGKMYDYFNYLTDVGVTVLRGESAHLEIGGNTVCISGIDDPDVDVYDDFDKTYAEELENVGNSIDTDHYNILLSHRPEKASLYFDYEFDLALAGHAHGGQGRIPFFLNGLFAPDQGFFPEYAGGIYDFDGQKMIVSRGLSKENTVLPRVFNRPELVFVTLK